MKCKHTCTSCCTLGGVGIFAKEKKLELMWINSVKKRRRKEVSGDDQTLASIGLACPISVSRRGVVSIKWSYAGAWR